MRKPPTCAGCPLEKTGQGWVPATGAGSNDILIIGEAPGAQEADAGVPWVGAAGHFLDKTLRQAGADRVQFRLHNVLSCRPPGNELPKGAPWVNEAILHCRQYLKKTVDDMQPKVILAMGGTALSAVTNEHGMQRCRGYVLPSYAFKTRDGEPIPTVATFHPSYLLPGRTNNEPGRDNPHRYLGMVVLDVKRALDIAKRGMPKPVPEEYLKDPDPHTADLWAEEVLRTSPRYLSVDIETMTKLEMAEKEDEIQSEDQTTGRQDAIIRIGFCDRPGHSMTIPWDPAHKPVALKLLASDVPKLFWNGFGFDVPMLQGNSEPVVIGGDIHDGMWAWHVLQSDLDRKLDRVTPVFWPGCTPWKHLMRGEPQYYNCMDTDAALRNMLGIEQELKSIGLWDFYLKYHRDLDPILYQAGRVNGLDIDREAQTALGEFLDGEIRSTLLESQRSLPEAVRNVTIYRRKPKDYPTVEVQSPVDVRVCGICGKENVSKTHPCVRDHQAQILKVRRPVTQYQVVLDLEACASLPLDKLWDMVDMAGLNPNSPQQLAKYVKHYKHKATGPSSGVDIEKMDSDALYWLTKRYGHEHPIYQQTSIIKDLIKSRGTYVTGFAPDAKGRIYTSFSRVPSTYRFSSRNVNLQNVSHRGDKPYADRIRSTIVPPPGHVFVSCDWSAIEAVLVGYFAEDAEYIRGAQAGIHDMVNCYAHHVDFNEENRLRSRTEWKQDREMYKRVVHLSNYAGTPHRIHQSYPEMFPRVSLAAQLQGDYFRMFPSLPKWHERVRLLAHNQHFLQSPWGFRHWFWRVYYKQEGRLVEGEDAKRCIAFLPQHTAAMMMSDLILGIPAEYRQYMRANLTIHDEVTLCVPEDLAERTGDLLLELMTRPVPQLGGLRVGAECKMGTPSGSWATVKPWKEVRV